MSSFAGKTLMITGGTGSFGNTVLKHFVNTEFEETEISIFPDKIVYATYQHNGWKRENVYWRDGTREETFKGRWKSRN